MKKNIIIISFFVISMFFLSNVIYAGNMIDYSVDPDICRFSDYVKDESTLPFVRFSAGRTEVDTDVNKSGICFSNNDINITSIMSKVQLMASSTVIKMTGSIEHSLLLSPTVIIGGEVTGTTLILGTSVNITENANVKGDLIIVGANVTFEGKAEGNVIIVGDTINVSEKASISGSIRMSGSTIDIAENADITGFIYAKYSDNLSISNVLREFAMIVKEEASSIDDSSDTLPIIRIVISSLVLGAIYVLIKNKSKVFDNAIQKLSGSALKVVIAGLVGIFALPIIAVISIIISVLGLHAIGITVLTFALGLLIIAAALKGFIVSALITEYMLKTNYAKYFESALNKFILFTIVLIILSFATYIPVVGGYIDYLLLAISFGILITFTLLIKTLNKENK